MTARTNVDELPAFDAAPYLDSDAAISAWLTDILQATDAGLLSAALGDSARARGMTEIAKAAGITREALCKALRPAARRASIRSAVFIPPPGGGRLGRSGAHSTPLKWQDVFPVSGGGARLPAGAWAACQVHR